LPFDNYYQNVRSFQGRKPSGQLAPPPPPPPPPPNAPPVVTAASGYTVECANSEAVTEFDGYAGVKSCDSRLQNNTAEAIAFLQTYNTRPLQFVEVLGYHMERRIETYTERDGDRDIVRERVVYHRVTDFSYKIDISQYIYPFGYMQCTEGRKTIPEIVQAYHQDSNCLKELCMEKDIRFDFAELHLLIKCYIRGKLKWHRGLDVSFPKANHTVRIWSENCCSDIYENKCLCCMLSLVTGGIYCCVAGCIKSGHTQKGIRSFWEIECSPKQVFHECVKQQLYVPGFARVREIVDAFGNALFW